MPISVSMTLCLNVVPFLRYSASKNDATLKTGLGVVQGYCKRRHSIDHIQLSIVNIALYCTVFELFDVE